MLTELWSDIRYRVRALFRRGEVERELAEELQFHIDREAAKHTRAGMAPDEALRRARVSFGGVERFKEESRESRGLSWLDATRQDLRYAARTLRSSPAFSFAVVATLGLGIGANAAMFSIVDQLLFRAPPFLRDPARVQRIYLTRDGEGGERSEGSTSYTRFKDLERWSTVFSDFAAFRYAKVAVGVGQDAHEMTVGAVSASFFRFFDAPPVIGRYFTAREDSIPAGTPVVVLSHPFWLTRFGGRPDVLGRQLQIDATMHTIIGVTPKGFVGTGDKEPPAAFIPLTVQGFALGRTHLKEPSEYYTNYHMGWLRVMARRKPGVGVDAASADLSNAFTRSYTAERAMDPRMTPVALAHPRALAAPILTARGPDADTVSKVATWTAGVAVIVLLVACANVANLLLARALRRRREIALRLALGVGRGRLFRQLLTESLLLAGLGGAAGLFAARWGAGLLRSYFIPTAPQGAPAVDWRMVGFAAIVTLAAGLLTGLAPLVHVRRTDLTISLKSGGRDGTQRRSAVRSGLLLAQGALSVVLLVGAGLFVRSLDNVRSLRLGYDVDPILYVSPNLRGASLSEAERGALWRRLEAAAAEMPGVTGASRALAVPFWSSFGVRLFVPGIDSVDRLGSFALQAGSPSYFETLGTRIVRGRGITAADRETAPKVVVVTEPMARILWPGKDALGQCLKLEADTLPCRTVVGIAETIKLSSFSEDAGLQYYLPIDQFQPENAELFVRVSGEAGRYQESVRRRLQAVMPGTAYVVVTPMNEVLGPNLRSWQLGATMFVAFGGLALILAAVGLYSVIAYNVAQRRQELGVRIALGARAADVLRLVVGEGIRFAAAGIAIGGALALAGGRWIGPLLFQVSPRDPIVFGAVAGVLLVVALLASFIPARRASRVDPNIALRTE